MDDETTKKDEQEQGAQEPQEVDWQAKYEAMRQHSRDWEKQAKANKAAAEELEQLKAAQMTEAERLTARAEKAEAELAGMKAEAERVRAAQAISGETDVPMSLLMYCDGEEAMRSFAKAYAEQVGEMPAAATVSDSKIVRGGTAQQSNRDVFAQLLSDQLKR